MGQPLRDRVFLAVNQTILVLLTALFVLPIVNVVACSLSSPATVVTARVYLWPVEFSLRSYADMLEIEALWIGYGNSLFYTIAGTALNLAMTVCAAYPLSCGKLKGRKPLCWLFLLTMFFGGGMIPTYLVVKTLGLIDTRAAMLLPGALGVSNMIIARTFFMSSVPRELKEAAEIDGAGEGKILLSVVLPLSKAILAVLGLYYAVGHWNNYFGGVIYLTDSRKYTVQMVLRDYLYNSSAVDEFLNNGGSFSQEELAYLLGNREVVKYGMIVLASIPMLALYPFIQRYFIQGVMVGSLKG